MADDKGKHGLWWWADRYRKSTAFRDLTLAQQGAYRNLLDEQRLRGGLIPNVERTLANACGDALAWPEVREAVLARFEQTQDGQFLFNRTASEVNAESDRISAAATVGGKARAEKAAREMGRFTSGTSGSTSDQASDATSGSTSDSASGGTSGSPASVAVVRSPLPLSVTDQPTDTGLPPAAAAGSSEPVVVPPERTAPRSRRTPKLEADPEWNGQAAEDWIAAYGGAPTKAFFSLLKPIVRKHGWARVRLVLRFYLAETPLEYANVSKLGSGFGSWEARAGGTALVRHGAAPVSAKAQARREDADEFIRAGLLEGKQ